MFKVQNIWRLITVAALLAGALNLSLVPASPVQALSSDVVISQVYGGGGGGSGTYIYDYVELFNLSTSAVNIGGWSVQYGSATGNFGSSSTNVYAFPSGTVIQPGKYLFVQLGTAGTGGAAFPVTPDITTTNLSMGATSGKAVLANISTALGCGATATPCTLPDSRIVDLAAYGASNNGEGGTTVNNGVAITNQQGGGRKLAGCQETDNNNADFDVLSGSGGTLVMRNSASPAHPCGFVTPNLTINNVSLVEGNVSTTTFTFTVSLSSPAPTGGVIFDIATTDGTATAGIDYTALSLSGQTIAEGSSSATFDVAVSGDTTYESNETFTVTVSNVSGATVTDGAGLGTIMNDDPIPPALSIDDVTIAEGNAGTTTFSFTVSLDIPAPAGGVAFDIATADGTATAGSDYVSNSVIGAAITSGNTSYTFDVTVNGDTTVEPTETFFVNVTGVTGATVTEDQGVGTITNDDAVTPELTIDNVTIAEGNAGSSIATFTVSLNIPALAGGVTFDIATADGTATTADSDYIANSTNDVTIAEGFSTATFDVTINGDVTIEPNETFNVNVSSVSGATTTGSQGVGTITNDDAPLPGLSIDDVTVTEGNSGTTMVSFTINLDAPAQTGGVTFDIATANNTATAGSDYVAKSLTSQTIASGGTSYTFEVTVNGDFTNEANESFHVNVTGVSGATVTDGLGVGTITNDDPVITRTYNIQGGGSATTLSGTYTSMGVVVGDYEGGASPELRGFYIQDLTGDGETATSDGLFIFNNNSNNNVALGDLVRVTGTVGEYQGQTQITATSIEVLSTDNTITPTDIVLPFASAAVEEQYEGMLVRVPQTLYVTEMYLLGRFGQVTMSGAGKLYQPTNVVLPGAPAIAMQATNNLNMVVVDDASQAQNPDPIVFGRGGLPLSASNTLRGGDTLTGLVGVFTYGWGGNVSSPNAYRIRPINAMGGGIPNFVAANPRPAAPPVVTGSFKAVGMNMLNYFNTFGNGACTNGVSGTLTDCRGANDATEFTRQSDKIVNAIIAMNADVIGIVEIENDGYGPTSAIQDLVTKLNAVAGAGTYTFINPDTANGVNSLGTDAIKVGILYKPAKATPVGTTVTLNTSAFINGGDSAARNRGSLLQAFQTANGERFLFNVNHLKSKGSACTDPDTGDGQGECNIVRTNAVNELLAWFATDPTGTGDPDILIVGDLNSYAKEDPIKAFETAGFTNMVNYFGGLEAYSYVFDGQWGYLDYAIGSPSLLAQVSGVADWHINSDEPTVLDYNTEFKTGGQIVSLYSTDPFRISDHDPVVTGLSLDSSIGKIPLTVTASASSITYGSTPVVTPNYTGFTGGDDASVLDMAPTCTAGAGPFIVAGSPYTTSCSGGYDNKYSFTYISGTLTVNPKALTITANNANKTYGATTTFAGTEFTAPGLVGTDLVASVTLTSSGAVNTANVGSYNIVPSAAVGTSLGNYTLTYANGSLAVNKATLTVTANNQSIFITKPDPIFTFAYAGFVNSETSIVIDTTPTCGVTGAHTAIGMYPITCSVGLDNNYGFTYINGTLTVKGPTFSDVPVTHWAWQYVESIYAYGITGGCGTGPLIYCPSTVVTRDQMAIFLLKAMHGNAYNPPAVGSSTGFNDVPTDYWAAAWIKQLAVEGVTGGCGNGNYCPTIPVTRDQMAVFLLRAKYGSAYTPPLVGAGTGFNDVPTNYWAAAWIKQLAAEGVTGGCGNGNYCPGTVVTRDQMAVFLVKTFNLP